jgi:hypothetical protein
MNQSNIWIVLTLAVGCARAEVREQGPTRGVGMVDSTVSSPLLLPDTIKAGQDFTVVVTTIGSSLCTHPAGAEVTMEGGAFEIVPYDGYTGGDACTADESPNSREVVLKVEHPGEVVVRVRARSYEGDVVFERTAIVRP